jgi:hypothetical protein
MLAIEVEFVLDREVRKARILNMNKNYHLFYRLSWELNL